MIINDLKEHKVSWESSFFVKLKERYEKALDKSVQRPTAVQGVYKCKNKGCSSDLFYTWTMQTRSGDEGMTHFRECAKCGKRGRC
ncbi:MAG TPA: late expression factor LEF-5 [Saprospiraceae bacterium]|nr:late expression factor LEF-5 [Saprospiraceae bacterium]